MLSGVKVDFSELEGTSQRNGLFLSSGLRGMLEGKDYRILDMIFQFVCGYVDVWTIYRDDARLSKVPSLYSQLRNHLWYHNCSKVWSTQDLEDLRGRASKFKICSWEFFNENCDLGLNTL